MFCSASAITFAIFGQLLVIFYKTTSTTSPTRTTSELLRIHYQLRTAGIYLMNCFTPILLVNCVHIFIGCIFNTYAFLIEIGNPKLLTLAIWDGILTSECFFRLWLICNTADSIRQSVRGKWLFLIKLIKINFIYALQAIDSIGMLRNLRNSNSCKMSVTKRHQVVHFSIT